MNNNFHTEEAEKEATATQLEQKWGEALNAGFVVVPSALFRHQRELGLGDGEVVVLMNLLMSWWKPEEFPFPHTATLARRMDTTPRTIQRYIGSLQEKGLLQRLPRVRTGKERSGVQYDLSGLVARLKQLGREAHPRRRGMGNVFEIATAAVNAPAPASGEVLF
ncbi:MAG TPA: helix-turn-helix domain-containing protein [Burkholderiales bacterium]|nr:helix-turn-helix domain-containing protein [Burkholderiales bacterium]